MGQTRRIKRKKKPKIIEFFSEMDTTKLILSITTIAVILIAIVTVVIIIARDSGVSGDPDKSGNSSAGSSDNAAAVQLTAVEGVEVVGTTEKSVSLKWKKTNSAEGYKVYVKHPQSDTYKVEQDSKETKCTVEGLEQGETYSLYVTPYFGSNEYTSDYSIIKTFTLPSKPSVTALSTDSDGSIKIEWTPNEKAAGFRVDYKKADNKNFATGDSQNIPGGISCSAKFSNVEMYQEYDFRVCAYILSNGEKYESASEVYTVSADPVGNTPDEIIDPDKPMVALTFDDGPGWDASEQILDVLEENNAKATFFMIGANIAGHSDNLKRKVELGMELGNHTWAHNKYGTEVNLEEITKASEEIKKVSGRRPTAFRTTGGDTPKEVLSLCKQERIPAYNWTIDSGDWKEKDADKIYDNVMKNVKDGDIVRLHEVYDCTAEAVAKIVPELKSRGFQIVTCRQLVIAKTGALPVPGTEYKFVKNMDNLNNKKSED